MRRCHHPNLVECLGFFHGEDELALLMTLAPGGDCQQLLQRHGALSERAATAIVQQLAAALHYMHTGPGVLHRDVKLENVLVSDVGYTATGTPRIKLCDFGHSCLLEGSCHGAARDDGFRGTQGYAAPEVAQPGAPPLWTTAADVWGVGVVYYALLANEVRPPSPPPLLAPRTSVSHPSPPFASPPMSSLTRRSISRPAVCSCCVGRGESPTCHPRRLAPSPPPRPPRVSKSRSCCFPSSLNVPPSRRSSTL